MAFDSSINTVFKHNECYRDNWFSPPPPSHQGQVQPQATNKTSLTYFVSNICSYLFLISCLLIIQNNTDPENKTRTKSDQVCGQPKILLTLLSFYCFKKEELRERVKLQRKERGVDEEEAPFIYDVISVRFKF